MAYINKKRLITPIILIVIVLIAFIGVVYYLNRPSTLTIITDDGAEISMATEQGGDFKSIGRGTAKYKTSDLPVTVYVKSEKDNKKTITGVDLKRGTNPTIDLFLSKTISAEKISDGGVIDPFFNGSVVQGIVPGQNILTSFRTDSYDVTRPELTGLPSINKVVWYDYDNFIYVGTDGNVGRFIQGVDLGSGILRVNILGNLRKDNDESVVQLVDAAQKGNSPLVLLSSSNILTSTDKGSTLKVVAERDNTYDESAIFASESSFFIADSTQAQDGSDDPGSITIYEYDYSGKKLNTFTLKDDSPLVKIIKHKETTLILTVANMYTLSGSGSNPEKTSMYFPNSSDIEIYNEKVVVLGEDGIWQFDDSSRTLRLLFDFSDTGSGLRGSLTVTPDKRLVFGTSPNDNGTGKFGALYSSKLD